MQYHCMTTHLHGLSPLAYTIMEQVVLEATEQLRDKCHVLIELASSTVPMAAASQQEQVSHMRVN